MLSVGPLWGLTVTARGGPSIRGMGKKNAAAGLGPAAVAARVTAANTRAVARVGRMGTSIGGMDGFTSPSELCPIMAWIDVMAITQWSISCQKVRKIIVADQIHCLPGRCSLRGCNVILVSDACG